MGEEILENPEENLNDGHYHKDNKEFKLLIKCAEVSEGII